MTTPTPEITATWTDAGVTLRIRHLDALEQQASYITAAAQPRTCPETPSAAARTA